MNFREHMNGGLEGHGTSVFEAVRQLPDGPPSDGEDYGASAEKAQGQAPSPSQEFLGDGPSAPASHAKLGVPSPESGEAGLTSSADKADVDSPVSPLISQLAELQYRRKFYIGLVNKQGNAAKALTRRMLGWRYDTEETDREKVNGRAARIVAAAIAGKEPKAEDADVFNALAMDFAVTAAAIEPCQKARDQIEKDMRKAARQLPVYDWAKGVHGFGELGLAVLVGEAGDIGSYPKKGHLWKRLGMAPHNGYAYSTWRREGGLSADDWVAAGYSPRRRAEVYAVISEPLFRQQSVVAGPYRAIYDRRRAATAVAHPDWTKAHSHADGLRVMTKYLLRDLWQEWRRAVVEVPSVNRALPAANLNLSEATLGVPSKSTAAVALPSSDPISQPNAGGTNEQEATQDAPRSEAVVNAPTARPIRRKAKDVAPKADTAQPSDDERKAGKNSPNNTAVYRAPTARPHTKRRKAVTDPSEKIAPIAPD